MLQPIPEERATAKELKILLKKFNLVKDEIIEEIDLHPGHKKSCFKTKK